RPSMRWSRSCASGIPGSRGRKHIDPRHPGLLVLADPDGIRARLERRRIVGTLEIGDGEGIGARIDLEGHLVEPTDAAPGKPGFACASQEPHPAVPHRERVEGVDGPRYAGRLV